jgi:diguanylate cyclase (GGDEF)-like protein
MIEAMLVQLGSEVHTVADGAQAWESLQTQDRPSLAILDWMMPGMDGLEICRRMRTLSDGPYVYIILLTVKDQKADIAKGFEAGADDYISKPFDPDELRGRLRAAQRVMDLQATLLATQRELRVQATRDVLTGLWNRGAILDVLNKELVRATREGKPAGVMLADVDHFKRVNDTYGHAAGDTVLRQIGDRLQATVRAYDFVGRYGGEEMLVVVPACDVAAAARSAERIRECVAAKPFVLPEQTLPVTLTIGVCSTIQVPASATSGLLIGAADAALYRGKKEGRNQVVLATPVDIALAESQLNPAAGAGATAEPLPAARDEPSRHA